MLHHLKTTLVFLIPFGVAALALLPLFVARTSRHAKVSGTSTFLSFKVGELQTDRAGILLPRVRSEVVVRNVGDAEVTLSPDKSGALRLISTGPENGQCSFSLANARVLSARPSAGDQVRLAWRETDADWMDVLIQPPANRTASGSISIDADGTMSEISHCRNSAQLADQKVSGVIDVACDGNCSYRFRSTGEALNEQKIPLAPGSRIDTTDPAERVPGIKPGGQIAFEGLKPIVLSISDYLILDRAKDASIDLNFDKRLQFTADGDFGSVQTGGDLSHLPDARPTWWNVLTGDEGFDKYVTVTVALGAAMVSLLTRLKVVPKE